jgi:hypothetical protein
MHYHYIYTLISQFIIVCKSFHEVIRDIYRIKKYVRVRYPSNLAGILGQQQSISVYIYTGACKYKHVRTPLARDSNCTLDIYRRLYMAHDLIHKFR